MEDIKVIEALHNPVSPDEIKWRQARYDKPNGYVKMLAYVDARYVMDVLDNVVGSENWQNEYMEIKGRIFCKLTIQLPSGKTVSKMDCGVETDIEAEKGAVSDALKRVAVLFGIGRDLYSMGDHFAETNDRGYVDLNTWETPRSEAIPEKVQIPRTGAKEPTTSALAQSQSDETAVESPPPVKHVPTTESIIASGVKPAYKLPPPIGQDDEGKAFVTVPNIAVTASPAFPRSEHSHEASWSRICLQSSTSHTSAPIIFPMANESSISELVHWLLGISHLRVQYISYTGIRSPSISRHLRLPSRCRLSGESSLLPRPCHSSRPNQGGSHPLCCQLHRPPIALSLGHLGLSLLTQLFPPGQREWRQRCRGNSHG